jgi:hypothetical protein
MRPYRGQCIYWNEQEARRGDYFVIRQDHIEDYYAVISSNRFIGYFIDKKLNGQFLDILHKTYGNCNFSLEHWLTNTLPADMKSAWTKKNEAILRLRTKSEIIAEAKSQIAGCGRYSNGIHRIAEELFPFTQYRPRELDSFVTIYTTVLQKLRLLPDEPRPWPQLEFMH